MSDLSKRIAALSPEQRAVFEQRLKQKGLSAPRLQVIPKRRAADALPLSFAQQRLWFLDQLEPGNPFYNIPTAVRLTGDPSLPALTQALTEIVRRHEALRTTFLTVDGSAVQVISPERVMPLPVTDLAHLPTAKCEAEARRLAEAEAMRPFDLAKGPLMRAGLIRLGAQDHLILLTLHHIVSDGWSL